MGHDLVERESKLSSHSYANVGNVDMNRPASYGWQVRDQVRNELKRSVDVGGRTYIHQDASGSQGRRLAEARDLSSYGKGLTPTDLGRQHRSPLVDDHAGHNINVRRVLQHEIPQYEPSGGAQQARLHRKLEMPDKSRNAPPNDITLGQERVQTFQHHGAGSAGHDQASTYPSHA